MRKKLPYSLFVPVSDRVRENEAVKLIRLKEGMLKFTEAYVEMATKCSILFSSQRVS